MVGPGFLVGLTNPKTMVFLTAILPGFVNRSMGLVPGQLLVLGLIFVVIALVCDSTWGLAAGTARGLVRPFPEAPALARGRGRLGHDRARNRPGRNRPHARLTGVQAEPGQVGRSLASYPECRR